MSEPTGKDQAPAKLWLQYYGLDAQDMQVECGDDWKESREVTWCVVAQYDTDVEYIPADIHEAEIERLKDALRRAADEPNIDRARAIADAALGDKHE